VNPAKTAEPIEMPSGLRTWLGPRDHVLDGGLDPPWEGANLGVRMGVPFLGHCGLILQLAPYNWVNFGGPLPLNGGWQRGKAMGNDRSN